MEDTSTTSTTIDDFLQQAECEPDKEGLSLFDLPDNVRPAPREAVGKSIPKPCITCSQLSTRLQGRNALGFKLFIVIGWPRGAIGQAGRRV
jgi:hypothetical protein